MVVNIPILNLKRRSLILWLKETLLTFCGTIILVNFCIHGSQMTNHLMMCRLDYLLISNSLKGNVTGVDIKHGFKSDHSLVTLIMCNDQAKHGKGMWKFNVSLLDDSNYTNLVRETIAYVKNDNPNVLPDILCETMKCVIRGETIKYASQKRHQIKRREENLERDINNLEIRYAENTDDENILRDIDIKRHNLDLIYEEKIHGAIIRSKADCIEFGEKV